MLSYAESFISLHAIFTVLPNVGSRCWPYSAPVWPVASLSSQVPTSTRALWHASSSTRTLSSPARTTARSSCGTWRRASSSATWWRWRAAAAAVWCGESGPPTPSWCAPWAAATAPRRPSCWCWTLTWTWSEAGGGRDDGGSGWRGGTTTGEGAERFWEGEAHEDPEDPSLHPQIHRRWAVLSSTIIFLAPLWANVINRANATPCVQP